MAVNKSVDESACASDLGCPCGKPGGEGGYEGVKGRSNKTIVFRWLVFMGHENPGQDALGMWDAQADDISSQSAGAYIRYTFLRSLSLIVSFVVDNAFRTDTLWHLSLATSSRESCDMLFRQVVVLMLVMDAILI